MLFSEVIGQDFIKKHLISSSQSGRIAHAQLFVGKAGSGILPMALAYARHIICNNPNSDDHKKASCDLKFNQLSHPDLHFVFPVATTGQIKSRPVSTLFMTEWRSFLDINPYASLFDWHKHLGIEKKQAQIGVDEALSITKALSLKSYEGGYKVVIFWMVDKMNTAAANKLLKLIEEPPDKTLFLLLTEQEDQLIDTIKSRCQKIQFPNLSESQITEALIKKGQYVPAEAQKIAYRSQGDYNTALGILNNDTNDLQFEEWFVTWVRTAFKAKGKKGAVLDLIVWSEDIAKSGRETQKSFLNYCVHFFRQALLLNYKVPQLVYLEPQTQFELSKFAPFVHGNNILAITTALQDAAYHIERNGNPRIILTDLSIKLTRLLHRKTI